MNLGVFPPSPSLQGPVVPGLHPHQPPVPSCEFNLCNADPRRGPGEAAEVDGPGPGSGQRQPLHPLCHLPGLLHVQTGKDVFSQRLPRVQGGEMPWEFPLSTAQLGVLTQGSAGLVAPELLLLNFSFHWGGGSSWISPFHLVHAPAVGVIFLACFRGILCLQLWHNRFMSCFCFSGMENPRFALKRGLSKSSRCSFCCVFYL